jgi:hypothetical protein
LSGGTAGAILATIGAVASLVTLATGSIAQAAEPIDYSQQISTLTGHRDEVAQLASEYETLAAITNRTEEESVRMNTILERLASSSMILREALTDSTGSFVQQGDAIREVNGYLSEMEQRINNLKREEAAASFKDISGVTEAQKALEDARNNEKLWHEYQKFLESDAAQYTDFPTYVSGKILEFSDIDHIQEQMYWAEIDDQ